MMKRFWPIFVLLFANIVLVAHAVIPHHHHSSIICVKSSHCESDSDKHDHETPLDSHRHDGPDNPENCVLKQIIAIPSNHSRQIISNLDSGIDHFAGSDLNTSDNYSGIVKLVYTGLFAGCMPVLSSNYLYFINSSLGLRAPPLA